MGHQSVRPQNVSHQFEQPPGYTRGQTFRETSSGYTMQADPSSVPFHMPIFESSHEIPEASRQVQMPSEQMMPMSLFVSSAQRRREVIELSSDSSASRGSRYSGHGKSLCARLILWEKILNLLI